MTCQTCTDASCSPVTMNFPPGLQARARLDPFQVNLRDDFRGCAKSRRYRQIRPQRCIGIPAEISDRAVMVRRFTLQLTIRIPDFSVLVRQLRPAMNHHVAMLREFPRRLHFELPISSTYSGVPMANSTIVPDGCELGSHRTPGDRRTTFRMRLRFPQLCAQRIKDVNSTVDCDTREIPLIVRPGKLLHTVGNRLLPTTAEPRGHPAVQSSQQTCFKSCVQSSAGRDYDR